MILLLEQRHHYPLNIDYSFKSWAWFVARNIQTKANLQGITDNLSLLFGGQTFKDNKKLPQLSLYNISCLEQHVNNNKQLRL